MKKNDSTKTDLQIAGIFDIIFSQVSFCPHFKPFSSKSFYTTIQGIVLILSMHML